MMLFVSVFRWIAEQFLEAGLRISACVRAGVKAVERKQGQHREEHLQMSFVENEVAHPLLVSVKEA